MAGEGHFTGRWGFASGHVNPGIGLVVVNCLCLVPTSQRYWWNRDGAVEVEHPGDVGSSLTDTTICRKNIGDTDLRGV